MKSQLQHFATASELQEAAARFIVRLLNEAIRARGTGTLILSGGSTPKAVYELLASEQFRSQLDWKNVHLFWGDERCVPPTHADSNYRMTNEALLQKIPVPPKNVHRIEGERLPREAAELYEKEIRIFFGLKASQRPRFDVTLLGMGEDGHTASLFPGTTILNETKRLVSDVFLPKFNAHRISMTYPTINNSRSILFLISGAGKAKILHEALEGEPNRYPAQRVQPTHGTLFWLVDAAASTDLQLSIVSERSPLDNQQPSIES